MESGLGTDTWGKGKAQLLGSAVSLSVIFSAGTVIFGLFFYNNETCITVQNGFCYILLIIGNTIQWSFQKSERS